MTRLLIINCTGDTLTTTASGGIGAWVLGVVAAARSVGDDPAVLTKAHPSAPCALSGAVELTYPWPRPAPGFGKLDAAVRRLRGYPHPWQWRWNRRVLHAVRQMPGPVTHIVCNNDPELAVYLARRLRRVRVHHLLHNTNTMQSQWLAPYRQWVTTLTISDFIARWAEGAFALPQRPTVVHNGVDAEAFRPSGDKATPPVVSYVGLLNERKGPDLLLASVRLLVARGVGPLTVRLFGDVHYGASDDTAFTQALRQVSEELISHGVDVEWRGFVSRAELARRLPESTVHVVPSRVDEAFSLAALEGMACGVPTVVTDRGALPEVVGAAGLVVPGDDPESLSQALASLLGDADLREDLAAAGRLRAETMTWVHTWHRAWQLVCQDSAPRASDGEPFISLG